MPGQLGGCDIQPAELISIRDIGLVCTSLVGLVVVLPSNLQRQGYEYFSAFHSPAWCPYIGMLRFRGNRSCMILTIILEFISRFSAGSVLIQLHGTLVGLARHTIGPVTRRSASMPTE